MNHTNYSQEQTERKMVKVMMLIDASCNIWYMTPCRVLPKNVCILLFQDCLLVAMADPEFQNKSLEVLASEGFSASGAQAKYAVLNMQHMGPDTQAFVQVREDDMFVCTCTQQTSFYMGLIVGHSFYKPIHVVEVIA